MNESKITKLAELAFVRAVPDSLLPKLCGGRLRNLCIKLIKTIDNELAMVSMMPKKDLDKVEEKIKKFGKLTGWEGKTRHVTTTLSFLLALIEESDHKYDSKILTTLNEIYDYFDRKKETKLVCNVAGAIAVEKWNKIRKNYDASM